MANFLQDLNNGSFGNPKYIDKFKSTSDTLMKQLEQPKEDIKPVNFLNFGPGVSQKGVTNVKDFMVANKTPAIQQTAPIPQNGGFSLLPTANAETPETPTFDDKDIEAVRYLLENGFTQEEALNKVVEYKKQIEQPTPIEQPAQNPYLTGEEQTWGDIGLNITGNIYKGVENLGADVINIGSKAMGSDFRVKPLREQLFNTGEEYKGGVTQNIANVIEKRGNKLGDIVLNNENQTGIETQFQGVANLGAGITDVIGTGFMAGLSTLTPDKQKEELTRIINGIAQTEGGVKAIEKAKEIKKSYEEFKKENPRAGRNVSAVLDTLNFGVNSGVIKIGDKVIKTGINKTVNAVDKGISKVGQGINTFKTEVKEGLDRGFNIPGKAKTVVDNTIQNTTKAKTKGGVEFDVEDKPGFTTKIFDKILSKDNEILAQQSVMPKATKEKTLKGRSQSSKTALEGIEQLYEDKAKGIIQEDIKSMPGGVNGMDEGLSYYGKKIGELTDNKAIIDTTDLVNNLEKSLNEPFSGINSSMKSVVTNIIDEFKKINYQASIGDLQNALSNIKSEIFSNAENISKLYKTNTGKALNNFLNEIDIRFNKTIENTTGNLPELLEAKKAYSKYKKIQKDFTDSLMVDIRNQGKGLTGTAGKIAGLYEVLNNPSISGVFKAVVLKNVAEKMQYYKTRSGNYETLIRKLDKEALERFKTNNLENDINSNISRSTDTTEPIKALPPGKKEPIITPQTKENAVIQQSKQDLQKAKIGTTTPQPKLLKKSPLSDREKAIIRQEPKPTPKPKVGFKIGDKKPLKKEPTTAEKVVSGTTQAKENKPLLKKGNEIIKSDNTFDIEGNKFEFFSNTGNGLTDYKEAPGLKINGKEILLPGSKNADGFLDKEALLTVLEEEKGNYKRYSTLSPKSQENYVKIITSGVDIGELNKIFNYNKSAVKTNKHLLKKENLEKAKEMFKKDELNYEYLSNATNYQNNKLNFNSFDNKPIEGSIFKNQGEFQGGQMILEKLKEYINTFAGERKVKAILTSPKGLHLTRNIKTVDELNGVNKTIDFLRKEFGIKGDDLLKKAKIEGQTPTKKLLSKEKVVKEENGLVKKEDYDEVKKSIPAGVFNRSQSEIFKIAKEKGLLDYKKIGTDYFYYDVKDGWQKLEHNGNKFKQYDFNPNAKINYLKAELKQLEEGLNDTGVYNTKNDYAKVKEQLDFFNKYEYNKFAKLEKDLGYYADNILKYKDDKKTLDIVENQLKDKLVRDYNITDTTKLAKVKEVIQKYLKEYGENIKNYLGLLADDIADIVGGRAKLLGGENAKLFDKSRWEQAKEMTRAGKSADEVWQNTGWEKGTDGKWKFEIDDNEAKLKDKSYLGYNNFKLEDILEHPTLYKQYPEIKDISVFFNNSKGLSASYTPKYNQILINTDMVRPNDNIKSTLIHELQHYIQTQEGFAKGGSPEMMGNYSDYQRLAGETEARNIQTRLNKTPAERKLLRPEKTEDVERSKQIVKMEGGKAMSVSDELISDFKGKLKKNSKGEIELNYIRNTEKAPKFLDDRFLQSIEPKGQYFLVSSGYTPIGWIEGKKVFKNPLIIENISTGKGGWKEILSKKYGNVKGEDLSKAIINNGYDGIITYDNIRGEKLLTESVDLTHIKATKPKLLKKATVSDELISEAKKYKSFEDINKNIINEIQGNDFINTFGTKTTVDEYLKGTFIPDEKWSKDINLKVKNNIDKNFNYSIPNKSILNGLNENDKNIIKYISEAQDLNLTIPHGYGNNSMLQYNLFDLKSEKIKKAVELLNKSNSKIKAGYEKKFGDPYSILYFDIGGRQVSFHTPYKLDYGKIEKNIIENPKWIGKRTDKNILGLTKAEYNDFIGATKPKLLKKAN